MGSVLSWAANIVLFVAGCWLAAGTANQVIAAVVFPTAPVQVAAAPRTPATPPRARTWAEREIILTRNLFHSSLDTPTLSQAELDAQLEKSKLPVTLLGTFAASDPSVSRATLMDKEKNETLVVGIGDQIKNTAEVMRIERRRVVIQENGAPRELTFGDDDGAEPLIRRAPRRTAAARPPETQSGVPVSRETIEKSMRDPSELLSQARVIPKYEQGQMVGLQVNAIKPGSLFQEIGLRDGDLITQFNGIAIDSPDQSARIFQELASAREFNVVVRGADGTESTKSFTPE